MMMVSGSKAQITTEQLRPIRREVNVSLIRGHPTYSMCPNVFDEGIDIAESAGQSKKRQEAAGSSHQALVLV